MKTNRGAYSKNEKLATEAYINGVVGGMSDAISEIGEDVQEAVNTANTAQTSANTALGEISAHKGNASNPHGVTKTQVGLSNVDNTPDAQKPLSAVQKAYVDSIVVGMYRTKGSREFANLPTSGQEIGDVYNVLDNFTIDDKQYSAGTNVSWTGSEWDPLAPDILGFSNALNKDFSLMPPVTTLLDADLLVLQAGATNCNITWLDLKKQVADIQFPIGKVEEWGDDTDPNTLYPWQTWARYGAGMATVGYNNADVDFNEVGKSGGAKTHTLTLAQMPVHDHKGTDVVSDITYGKAQVGDGGTFDDNAYSGTITRSVDYTQTGTHMGPVNAYIPGAGADVRAITRTSAEHGVPRAGEGAAHNNLQPYIVVGRWIRVS